MSEILILSCTNRLNSNTLRVSGIYQQLLRQIGVDAKVFDFCKLPHTIAFSESYGNRSEQFEALIAEYIRPTSKFIFIMPEYNGSFPGILKVFLDSMSPREWNDKKACLVGVADGRAGNLRGMEHLTGILQYLKMHVYHNKLPISVVNKMYADNGLFTDEQNRVCLQQLEGFIKF